MNCINNIWAAPWSQHIYALIWGDCGCKGWLGTLYELGKRKMQFFTFFYHFEAPYGGPPGVAYILHSANRLRKFRDEPSEDYVPKGIVLVRGRDDFGMIWQKGKKKTIKSRRSAIVLSEIKISSVLTTPLRVVGVKEYQLDYYSAFE